MWLFEYGELESPDEEATCRCPGELRLRLVGSDTDDLPDAAANFQRQVGIVWGQVREITQTEFTKLQQSEGPEYGPVNVTVGLPDGTSVKCVAFQYLNMTLFKSFPRIHSGNFQTYMKGKK